jgi:2-polyprenyl-6-methoxyphenol hydroxylase-like FAD-dependent oxidoreductase
MRDLRIGAAINLAWKLATVLRYGARESLLGSYEAERRAFALKLVDMTNRLFTLITAESHFADFVHTRIALAILALAYGVDAAREYMFRMLPQTLISYHDSPISAGR